MHYSQQDTTDSFIRNVIRNQIKNLLNLLSKPHALFCKSHELIENI